MTVQQIIDAFALSESEQTEAATLIARVVSPLDSISLGGFVTLTNVGAAYDTTPASKGLGVCRIETFGVSGFEFGVFVNKVGSGTQSWQLWDQTNSAQLAVIDDAGASGEKTLAVSQAVSPLPASLRTLRVRVKSTTAADDPVFYGASLALRRIGMMTADVLHQILLLAEDHINPLHTEDALKARLGV
jgi:hypothetical protein